MGDAIVEKADGRVDPSDELVDTINDGPAERLSEACHLLGQHKGVNISIEVSDTFAFDSPEEMTKAIKGELPPEADDVYIYSRSFNPTVKDLGRYLAAMEGTEKAYCTASGMSAITATLMYLCQTGGHVVAAEKLYGGTYSLVDKFLREKCNITHEFVDIENLEKVREALDKKKTDVLYFDSISNPDLIVSNIPELCKIAHAKGVTVVVDNTFTPMIISPAAKREGVESDDELADIVIHSLTKYVSGGSDIIGGAICGKRDMIKNITNFSGGALMMLGPVLNPKEAFELLGRMAHLGVRMKKHCSRALKLATRMKELGVKVIYPGLEDHPNYELMNKLRNKGYGYGGMLCVDMETTEKAYALMTKLREKKFGFLAISLGYYENLISCPGATSNGKRSPGYMRFSIGYLGSLNQKWELFKQAYEEVVAKPQ